MMLLSILIVTLENRKAMFDSLMENLTSQIFQFPTETIEILHTCDNGEQTTGFKRDLLLRNANGKYVSYVDDDDHVYSCYVSEIIKAAESDADCFSIAGIMTTNSTNEIGWRLSKDYPNTTVIENGKPFYLRTTNHLSPVKRSIALLGGFPDIRNGEDKAYSESIRPNLKTEYRIEPPLYHYQYTTGQKLYK